MNRTWRLLFGVIIVVFFSFSGLVVVPSYQQGTPLQRRVLDKQSGLEVMYPPQLSEYLEASGRNVYRSEGCIYCHSQQVRPESFGCDAARGWGERRSVPLDYVLDAPPLMGTMRTGPDLANIGARQPSDAWHHLHLYDARIVSPGSIMPPFKYLYRVVHKDPGSHGYKLDVAKSDGPAWIVPSQEAKELVAYIKTLHQDHELTEVR